MEKGWKGRVDRGRKLKRSEKRVARRGVRWRGEVREGDDEEM